MKSILINPLPNFVVRNKEYGNIMYNLLHMNLSDINKKWLEISFFSKHQNGNPLYKHKW